MAKAYPQQLRSVQEMPKAKRRFLISLTELRATMQSRLSKNQLQKSGRQHSQSGPLQR